MAGITQTEPDKWRQPINTQPINTLAPFGKYPSMDEVKSASVEAEKIKSEGDEVVIVFFDPKAN
ncbi:hypothetical protein CSE6_053_50810 [Comamonas sp. E6]|nr:hypothetical protein CSE6_053_50810 [Comamonas sp. E6]